MVLQLLSVGTVVLATAFACRCIRDWLCRPGAAPTHIVPTWWIGEHCVAEFVPCFLSLWCALQCRAHQPCGVVWALASSVVAGPG